MNTDRIQLFKDKIQGTEIFHLLMHARNYFSAEVATRAIGFISIPVFTRLYTTADFGMVAVFMSYFAIFSVLIPLNSHSAVGRYYYENTDDFLRSAHHAPAPITTIVSTTIIAINIAVISPQLCI